MRKLDSTKSLTDNLAAFGFYHMPALYVPYRTPAASRMICRDHEFVGFMDYTIAFQMLDTLETEECMA